VPGCSPANFSFAVKSDGSRHPVSQPEAGKALVYFLQDDKAFESHPRPTVKWGLDGNWVGATQGDTYFYLSVDPGDHHLCAECQSAVLLDGGRPSAADHFTTEAGKSYYFRAQGLYWGDVAAADVKLGRVNSEEGPLLMTQFGFSNSHPKK
jgi:hypothetical protein